MSSDEVAISVQGISKMYQIYARPGDRLKQIIVPRLKRMMFIDSVDYFEYFWALQDVSFEVKKGHTVGIIGRNGSGKSTLLQLVCGTLSPTFGQVEVNGRVAALLELGAGFNTEFTGRENVYLNAALLGLGQRETDDRYQSIVDFADIGQFIDQPVKSYSSGACSRRRVVPAKVLRKTGIFKREWSYHFVCLSFRECSCRVVRSGHVAGGR